MLRALLRVVRVAHVVLPDTRGTARRDIFLYQNAWARYRVVTYSDATRQMEFELIFNCLISRKYYYTDDEQNISQRHEQYIQPHSYITVTTQKKWHVKLQKYTGWPKKIQPLPTELHVFIKFEY